MKRMSSIIVGSLVAILIMGGTFAVKLHAQVGPGVVFNVPFAFSLDGHNIAAGNYKLNLVSGQYILSIRNLETGDLRFFGVQPGQQHAIEEHGRLVFGGCGYHRYLAEFHMPGTDTYSVTRTPERVKNAEAQACPTGNSVFLAAR
ncbi:MAG TPA: hypothetical protein VK574_18755 [Terracidiphilus sp.]|nr:hypothetical protein [Terracidiphilus sp.]